MKDHYHGRYDNYKDLYGQPWYFIHRVDLHNELKRLALESGVDVQLSSEVTHVDAEDGLLTLGNGQSHRYDLIIAADGVHVGLHNATCVRYRQLMDFSLPLLEW